MKGEGGRGKWSLLEHGGGLCVGKLFLSVEWKVVSGQGLWFSKVRDYSEGASD